jgi:hypothetical protein
LLTGVVKLAVYYLPEWFKVKRAIEMWAVAMEDTLWKKL